MRSRIFLSIGLFAVIFTAIGFSRASAQTAPRPNLATAYQSIREEATLLAGAAMDMPTRALFLYQIYEDSNGNDAFPLVALHGALWGHHFFQVTGPLGTLYTGLRNFRHPLRWATAQIELQNFSLAFQETNRSVFIDTYTNYYFSKTYGMMAGADKYIKAPLLTALNRVHEATRSGIKFTETEKKEIYLICLYYEQELTVGPRIREALNQFNDPFLESIALKPIVHFAYFKTGQDFFFTDFSDQNERIARATTAFDIASRVGWTRVKNRMASYGSIPKDFFSSEDQMEYINSLKKRLLFKAEAIPFGSPELQSSFQEFLGLWQDHP